MSRKHGILLSGTFIALGSMTSHHLWLQFDWYVSIQIILILIVATFGEHYVSGKGYYYYTDRNGVFIGRVASWIPFMWVFAIQLFLIVPLLCGFGLMESLLISGSLGLFIDLVFVEPYFSKKKNYWIWNSVNEGYFSFIPYQFNRFTAPPGNYIVWYGFPIIMNLLLGFMGNLLTFG